MKAWLVAHVRAIARKNSAMDGSNKILLFLVLKTRALSSYHDLHG